MSRAERRKRRREAENRLREVLAEALDGPTNPTEADRAIHSALAAHGYNVRDEGLKAEVRRIVLTAFRECIKEAGGQR